MAAAKTHCVICGKGKATYKCRGCSKDFCFDDLGNHRQILGKQLDVVEDQRKRFRQTLNELAKTPEKHLLIKQINQWKQTSMNKIRETAEEARELVLKYMNKLETKLTQFTAQLKKIRQENGFNETHLNKLNEKLKWLAEQLNKPSNISIKEEFSSFIIKISVQ